MSNDELQQLKALALGATAGPWGCFANEEDSGEVSHDVIAINSGVHIFSEDHLPSEETAQYIAAASPDVILALIAKLEATPSSANGAEGLPEPKQAMTDAEILNIAVDIRPEDHGLGNGVECLKSYDLALARAILAASSPNKELVEALQGALAVIDDYLAYDHNGDPWTEDARTMGEMDINDYQHDGRLDTARAALRAAGVEVKS